MKISLPHSTRAVFRDASRPRAALLLLVMVPAWAPAPLAASPIPGPQPEENRFAEERKEMVDRGLKYLLGLQKEGSVGESRQKAVSSLFVLACLSSGLLPSHPEHGKNVLAAYDWIIQSSTPSFFGGSEEPHEDHAMAGLMLSQLVGTCAGEVENQKVYEKARAALAFSLQIQDKGAGGEHFGGWRPNDRTRENHRVLTAWFLLQLRGCELLGMDVSKSAFARAIDFVRAGQKFPQAASPVEKGGFSYGPEGLAVLHPTAAGVLALALFEPEDERVSAARDWLVRHRLHWYGPHFYESHFFAVRGLYRCRHIDEAQSFHSYFERLAQFLQEEQQPDGSFPLPPGEGGPILAMGRGYSTAMAILILNVDRGFLPIDQ